MRRPLLLAAAVGATLLAHPAAADCTEAAAEAERAHGIPPGLLLAIGRVESGRYDPARNAVSPWPWSVNAGGQGWYFADLAAATAHVAKLQDQGVRSIDVGCFQVNLMHHPGAFASAAEGFDPARNADYAARFLVSLYAKTGDWPAAAARYHSATPGFADAYRARVLAAWGGAAVASDSPYRPARLPGIVLASGMRVFVPGGSEPPRPGLPRVFTPGHAPLR